MATGKTHISCSAGNRLSQRQHGRGGPSSPICNREGHRRQGHWKNESAPASINHGFGLSRHQVDLTTGRSRAFVWRGWRSLGLDTGRQAMACGGNVVKKLARGKQESRHQSPFMRMFRMGQGQARGRNSFTDADHALIQSSPGQHGGGMLHRHSLLFITVVQSLRG